MMLYIPMVFICLATVNDCNSDNALRTMVFTVQDSSAQCFKVAQMSLASMQDMLHDDEVWKIVCKQRVKD